MKANDEDIKIFHPKKTDGAGADLAELALLMDTYRSNGNMQKAADLGVKLAQLKPENLCPKDAEKLKTNELRQLRALIIFSVQISLHKYMPHAMLASQAINAMYAEISEKSPGLFANISDGSSFTFYYLSVRNKKNAEESIGKNYAMLCDRDDDEFYASLGERVFLQTDFKVCDMIEEAEFKE